MTKTDIYASKLYITSSAVMKKKIHAAINNPLNAELLMQLPEDLDEEYQTVNNLVDESKQNPDKHDTTERSTGKESVDDKIDYEDRGETSKHHPNPAVHNDTPDKEASTEEITDTSESSSSESAEAKPEKPESSEVEESTKIKKMQKVEATSFPRACCPDMKQTCDTIKTMLNLNAASSGVERVFIKDNELSIVYNDDINLNNVMNEVIESLNASGYNYLAFNRLARSKNSIVFEINFADTANVVKPVSTILTDSE